MYLGDRTARTLGYATLVATGVVDVGSALLWGAGRSFAGPMDALGIVFPALWTSIVWVGAYWHRRRGTAGRDVAVVAAWVVGTSCNFGLLLWLILEHQRLVGVDVATPAMIVDGVAGNGMFHGLLIGTFHVFTREKTRTIDRERRTLRRRTEQLEFLNRLMRHDIRNDVAVIQGHAELLVDGGANGRVDRILRKSYHIEELTDLAQEVNATLDSDERRVVDLSAALEEALEQARAAYPDAEFVADADLSVERPVVANPLLSSVFGNLLSNAVVHNHASTPRVRVDVRVDEEAATVRVADNGPGVSESAKRNLFEAGEKSNDSSGMGLGLYLVETLVTNYGGDVWIEDNDPRGAVFTVKLELADSEGASRPVEAVAPTSNAAVPDDL